MSTTVLEDVLERCLVVPLRVEEGRELAGLLVELSGTTDGDSCAVRLGEVGRARAGLDADLLEAVVEVAESCRVRVLDLRVWWGAELTAAQERTLRSETKRAVITEVQVALGLATTEATTLAGLAMGPVDVLAMVVEALRRGETSWPHVRKFWEMAGASTRELSADQQLLVALSLFGTDPVLAAPERLDPDGELALGEPWPQAAFVAALTREVTACEGSDVAAERARRARAHRERRARIRVHDDGTATLVLTGPAVPVVGAWARYDHISRTLRSQGADRTLDQLVVDTMLSVLNHGRIDLPDPGSIGELSAEALDDLVAVVNGTPRIALQVVVPVDTLGLGHPVCATCAGDLRSGTLQPDQGVHDQADDDQSEWVCLPFDRGGQPPDWVGSAGIRPGQEAPPVTPVPADAAADGPSADRAAGSTGPAVAAERSSADPPAGSTGQSSALGGPTAWGHDADLRHGRGQVGEVLGSHPFFITPGHARELFFTPGTTMHRILVDSADSRCVERSITAYRPDADMRRQVHAADVYSRAPWARLTGRTLEIDHVIPYGTDPDGITTERNLADLDKRTHQSKTLRLLSVAIDERRDLTFTTLLGQVTRSRVHDYGQYLRALHPEDVEERLDLANQALYAALAARPEHRRRPGPDDWLTLDHTGADGERCPGPPEHPDDPHQLLDIPPDDGRGEPGPLDRPDSAARVVGEESGPRP